MQIQPAALPFHIAKAYGIARPAEIPAAAAPHRVAANAHRLIGATVPGSVDFSGQTPAPASPSIPLYRHPADRNAVATAIDAGRLVDLTA